MRSLRNALMLALTLLAMGVPSAVRAAGRGGAGAPSAETERGHGHRREPAPLPPWKPDFRPAKLPGTLLMGAIRLYQLTLSRALAKLPPGVISCKFEPSCSHYGFEAIRAHGPLKGCLLAAWRVMRCSSLTDGGHDPVPTPFKLPPLKRRYD